MGSCATLTSLAIYAVIIKVQGRAFDVGLLFTSLTLIVIATGPIFTLIQGIPTISSALVCLTRVQQFLVLERKSSKTHCRPSGTAGVGESSQSTSEAELKQLGEATYTDLVLLSAADATFAWSEEQPVLNNVSFEILRFSVNVVVGP
jgi:ATP-binding cassette, subfamily C (CFTR/MRP), member 1